jgi:hypothetical protein
MPTEEKRGEGSSALLYTVKKRLSFFLSSAGNNLINPGQEEFG